MSFPYNQTVTLCKPVKDAECWNFLTDTRFEFPAGTKFLVVRAHDAHRTMCLIQPEAGSEGIELFYEARTGPAVQQRGYRFIIPNGELAPALDMEVPPPTRDVVGDIMRFEEGEMDEEEAREFLIHLHDTGILFGLQGSYQRAYQRLVLEN